MLKVCFTWQHYTHTRVGFSIHCSAVLLPTPCSLWLTLPMAKIVNHVELFPMFFHSLTYFPMFFQEFSAIQEHNHFESWM